MANLEQEESQKEVIIDELAAEVNKELESNPEKTREELMSYVAGTVDGSLKYQVETAKNMSREEARNKREKEIASMMDRIINHVRKMPENIQKIKGTSSLNQLLEITEEWKEGDSMEKRRNAVEILKDLIYLPRGSIDISGKIDDLMYEYNKLIMEKARELDAKERKEE